MSVTVAHLTVIEGSRHAPPDEAYPELAGVFAAIWEEGWNACVAYVMRGDLRPARTAAGLSLVRDESVRLIQEASR